MSQKKVDRYKEQKANRKKEVKKARTKSTLTRLAGVIVCLAFVCWIGYSGYTIWESSQPAKTTEITTDALTNYLSDIASTEE